MTKHEIRTQFNRQTSSIAYCALDYFDCLNGGDMKVTLDGQFTIKELEIVMVALGDAQDNIKEFLNQSR